MIELKAHPNAKYIELGCGNRRHPACHIAVDVRFIEGVTDFVVNFEEPNWPIGSEEFDAAYSCFVLEHVSWRNTLNFLKECFRIIKPGGKLVLVTPNTEEQMRYLLRTQDWDIAGCALFGDLDYPENSHKAFINPTKLTAQLREVGFDSVLITPYGELKTDMVTQAQKPFVSTKPPEPEVGKITLQGWKVDPNVLGSNVEPVVPTPEVSKEPLPPASVLFNRGYWDGGNEYGGFQQGYSDFPCLPAGELIIAETGLREIETLKVGELVMTHRGRFRPIVEVMKRPYSGKLITIKPRYSPAVRLTPEHPVLVVPVARKYGTGKPHVVGIPEWIESGKIDIEKHWMVLPRPIKESQRKFDAGFLRLVGYYLSEGSIYPSKRGGGGVSFAFHREETSYIEDVRNLMFKRHTTRGCLTYSKIDKGVSVMCYAPDANVEFGNLGRDSYTKKIPIEMMQAEEDGITELLLGLFRGDGSFKDQDMIRLMTVSRSLASMSRLMLLRLGVVSAIKWQPPPKRYSEIKGRQIKSKGYWEICVTGKSYAKLAKLFRLGEAIEGRPWKKTNKEYDFCRMDDENVYVPIRSIKEEHYEGVVYNFEVEEDNSYMHPGVALHNCHQVSADHVLARKPEDVLELGAARGYIGKRLEDAGITYQGVDASRHCYLTRVCDKIVVDDFARNWRFDREKQRDLCFSIATLDHIAEQDLPRLVENMAGTCRRGLHGINFSPPGGDRTRQTCKPKEWWVALFEKYAPNWPVEILHKDELENGNLSPSYLAGDGKLKLNIGSHTGGFYHGWLNLDDKDLSQYYQQMHMKFKQVDIREGLPFDTESVSCIFSAHCLEHITYKEGLAFLKECRRVLRPDGAIRLTMPDAESLMNWRNVDDPRGLDEYDELSGTVAAAKTITQKVYELLHAHHFSMYDTETLCEMLQEAGLQPYPSWFRRRALVQGVGSDSQMQILKETVESLEPVSLFVEAYVTTV